MIEFRSTMDVTLTDAFGNDESIVAAARVSTGREGDKTAVFGLLNYLMKHRHGSPFEHNGMTFLIHAPIFVWRQFHKHRIGFSYNEESARYKTLKPVFYIPDFSKRPCYKVEASQWTPSRPKMSHFPEILQDEFSSYGEMNEYITRQMQESYMQSYSVYRKNLELGLDPGLARACLPVAIYSSCYVTCNARSLMHFLSLRTHDPESRFVSYPLAEIEMVARQMEEVFKKLFPFTHEAFVKNKRVSP